MLSESVHRLVELAGTGEIQGEGGLGPNKNMSAKVEVGSCIA